MSDVVERCLAHTTSVPTRPLCNMRAAGVQLGVAANMKRSLVLLLTVGVLLLAFAAPVAAHNMEVDPNGEAETKLLWVGGHPVPGQGEGLFPHPPSGGFQPAGHREGLPQACNATRSNPSAVTFIAPPPVPGDTDPCQHGVQLGS